MMILDRVVPFGRSQKEYELMFALSESDRHKSIVGIGDGPASFNAEMTAAGYQVTSIDPIYQFTGSEIKSRFDACVDSIIEQVCNTPIGCGAITNLLMIYAPIVKMRSRFLYSMF